MNWKTEELAIVLDFPGEFKSEQEETQKALQAKAPHMVVRNIQANLHLRIAVPHVSDDAAIGEIVAVSWGSSPKT